eukprot:1326843-Amphidinium_carterae.1
MACGRVLGNCVGCRLRAQKVECGACRLQLNKCLTPKRRCFGNGFVCLSTHDGVSEIGGLITCSLGLACSGLWRSMGKRRSRSPSYYSYSYYSDMDEEPDWSEGVEQVNADGDGTKAISEHNAEATVDEQRVQDVPSASATAISRDEDETWGTWSTSARVKNQAVSDMQEGQGAVAADRVADGSGCRAGPSLPNATITVVVPAVAQQGADQNLRTVESKVTPTEDDSAKRRSRELEVK